MNKLAKIAMVASVFMMPFAANAAPADGTYSGSVDVHKGLAFKCNLTAVVSGGATQATLSLSPGNLLCLAISLNNQPYAVTHNATDYIIHGIHVTTITPGGCAGDATGPYTATELDVDVVLPEDTAGTGDCSIKGKLTKVA